MLRHFTVEGVRHYSGAVDRMYGSSGNPGSFEGERRSDELPGAPETDVCAQIRPLLSAFDAERLDANRRDAVMRHIAGCAACSAQLDALREENYALLRAAQQPQPPADLRERLYARIAAAQAASRTSHTPTHALPLTRQQKGSRPMRTHEPVESLETLEESAAAQGAPATKTPPILSPVAPPDPLRHPRNSHSRSRLGAWFGAIAAALIVALLAGVLVTLARNARLTGVATTHKQATHMPASTTPTVNPHDVASCQPSQISASIPGAPDSVTIGDIAMTSDTSGWAVGAVNDSVTLSTMMLRYDHCAWQPYGAPIAGATLSAISMTSSSDGWAVGGYAAGGALALHYSNGAWRQVVIPAFGVRIMGLTSVDARAPDDVWLRAVYNNDNITGLSLVDVLHYQAGHWSLISSPYNVITSVTPVGANEFWAVVSSDTPDVVIHVHLAHYSHGGWTTFDVPGLTIDDTLSFASPDDGWAYISDAGINDRSQTTPIYHYDGRRWSQVTTTITPPTSTTLAYFTGAEGWAGAPTSTTHNGIQLVAHYTKGKWARVSWPMADVEWSGVLAAASSDDYWATGDRQVVMTNPGGTTSITYAPLLLHYTAGVWTAYS